MARKWSIYKAMDPVGGYEGRYYSLDIKTYSDIFLWLHYEVEPTGTDCKIKARMAIKSFL